MSTLQNLVLALHASKSGQETDQQIGKESTKSNLFNSCYLYPGPKEKSAHSLIHKNWEILNYFEGNYFVAAKSKNGDLELNIASTHLSPNIEQMYINDNHEFQTYSVESRVNIAGIDANAFFNSNQVVDDGPSVKPYQITMLHIPSMLFIICQQQV